VVESLSDVTLGSAVDLLSIYTTQASDLKPWLQGAIVNRDRNLHLQYMAALAVNNYLEAMIYDEMLAYRFFPENLFVGSQASLQPLRVKLRPSTDPDSPP
jgi:hypothetical protein